MSGTPPPPLPSDPPGAAAPPTTPAAIPPLVTQWPTTFGVLSIVLGAAGTLANACGVLGSMAEEGLNKFLSGLAGGSSEARGAAAAQQAAVLKAIEPYEWIATAISLGSTMLSVLPLVAGIRCLKRRPDAAKYHVVWAGLRILMASLGGVVAVLMYRAQMAAIAASGANASPEPFAGFAQFEAVIVIVVLVLSMLWSWAYPIVVLIWFNRAKVKAEVAAWRPV